MTRWHALPGEVYELVERTPATVLLESAPPAPADSQSATLPSLAPTRLFTEPLRICIANHPTELPNLFAEIERVVDAGLFAAGYFSYECGAFFEPSAAGPFSGTATESLAWFGIYQRPYLFDHITGAFAGSDPPSLDGAHVTGADRPADPSLDCTLGIAEEQYAERIAAIQEWIRAGDVYQLNFTIPLSVRAPGSSAALYRRLRSLQPAPYCAFLHTEPDHRTLSFSPELFFRIENQGLQQTSVPHPCCHSERSEAESKDLLHENPSQGWETTNPIRRITTRPMKGTAPRGRTTSEDRAEADWLRNDPKNCAENVMIVDLLRNDLGRLCAFGSVRAENLFAVERYPTLWQMTSTITGELRANVNFQQIFRALFPCGSVTGAPKVRAMQLLTQLEQRPRGIYTGAIGFFSRHESIFNVAIRTLSLDGEAGAMGVGSGIVIDSKPGDEWRECLLKAEFLTGSISAAQRPSPDSFSLVETMLWRDEYPFIDLHLDRLQDSADYFAFPFNRDQTRTALEAHAASFAAIPPPTPRAPSLRLFSGARVGDHEPESTTIPRKVRLLLAADGKLHISNEALPEPSSQPLRVTIAAQRTDSSDPMYFHKTTHRPLYAQAFQSAIEAGYDDVLFLNQRGEVTEAAIHNLFIEKNGQLLTPPIECGLLPGVHRRHILATRSNAQERKLTIDDLRTADALYLSNAVRGLRPAIIDWSSD